MKKVYPLVFVITFLVISTVPALNPGISIFTFETSFRGHNLLIQAFNNLRLRLGDHVFPNVLVGKQGWMFYTANRSIDDYQGTNPYSSSTLRDLKNNFDALNNQLKQKGILLVVVIAPDKSSIYPQYMPDQITKIGDKSRLDYFVDYMQKYGKTPVIDLRPDLIAASKAEQVYYKTETHWNPLGQYIAYTHILSVLSQRYPELVPHPLSDFEEVHAGLVTHDIPQILGLPNIKEDKWTLIPRFGTVSNFRNLPLSDGQHVRLSWNQNQMLPSALIYHDSFMNGVVPLLEPHFRELTSITYTALPGIWSTNWVNQEHPDVVIIEYAERFMNSDLFIPGNQ